MTEKGLTPVEHERLPALIDAYDTELIVKGIDPDVVEKWAYSFPVKGSNKPAQGLSVLGVQAAVRQAATRGEVIRCLSVDMTFEDKDEARFVATGARFIVDRDGELVELDRTIRAKRQPKWGVRAETGEPYFIENWYEIGYSKAARNVENALLHDMTKSVIKEAARQARAEIAEQRRPRQQRPQAEPAAKPEPKPGEPQTLEERNEWIAATRRGLEELQASYPALYTETYDSILARFPHASDRERRLVLSKLRLDEIGPVRELVLRAVDAATGRAAQDTVPAQETPPAPSQAAEGASGEPAPEQPEINMERWRVLVSLLHEEPDREAMREAIRADYPYVIMEDGRDNLLLLIPKDGEAVIAALQQRAEVRARERAPEPGDVEPFFPRAPKAAPRHSERFL